MDRIILQKMARANPIASTLLPSLRRMLPRDAINEEIASNVYKTCVSINQKYRTQKGKMLEKCVEDVLKEHDIPYLSQATVDTAGVIHALRGKRKGVHVHDFIIDASFGDTIDNKIIISCKTSLRERWRQDANVQCAKMYMITMDACSNHIMNSLKENNVTLVMIGADNTIGISMETCIQEIKAYLSTSPSSEIVSNED
jgi:hypothetical protein